MYKFKSMKRLLELVLKEMEESVDGKQFDGLCSVVISLHPSIIRTDQCNELLQYIYDNPPNLFSSFEVLKERFTGAYYWKKYSYPPRIAWLNKHIKIHERLEKRIHARPFG